jgi:nucleoside-diphosphate-sugar epimerase
MKRVLLAGITGYVGNYIAKELQKRAFDIRGIARSTAALHENGILPFQRC